MAGDCYNADDFSLLARATRFIPNDPEDIRKRLSQKTNWLYFARMAYDCGIASLFYRKLKVNGWDSLVPEGVLKYLKSEYVLVHGINMSYYRELAKIISVLQNEGIKVAVLKGAASAQYIYGDIGLRSFGDVDILVSKENFSLADSLLQRSLVLLKSDPPDGLSRRCSFHYLYTCKRPPRLNFELHWRLFPDDSRIDYPQEKFLQEIVSLEMNESVIPIPSAKHIFIHLCIHFTGHSFCSLRDLWDLAWMIDKNKVPWNHLDELSSGSLRNRMYYSLCLVESVFGMDLGEPLKRLRPPPMVRRFFPKELCHRGLVEKVADKQKDLRAYIAFLMLPTWGTRLKFLWCLMIPGICWLTIYPDEENPSPVRHRSLILLRGMRLIGYLVMQMARNFVQREPG